MKSVPVSGRIEEILDAVDHLFFQEVKAQTGEVGEADEDEHALDAGRGSPVDGDATGATTEASSMARNGSWQRGQITSKPSASAPTCDAPRQPVHRTTTAAMPAPWYPLLFNLSSVRVPVNRRRTGILKAS